MGFVSDYDGTASLPFAVASPSAWKLALGGNYTSAVRVTFTNTTGNGIRISGFTIRESYNSQTTGEGGTSSLFANLDEGSLPVFLAPGEQETFVVDWSGQGVTVSERVYLGSICTVMQWQ